MIEDKSGNFACDICGANRSKTGRLFDSRSLIKHKEMTHGAVGEEGAPELACGICGATQSTNGRKFITAGRLLQHVRRMHPEAVDTAKEAQISKNDSGGSNQVRKSIRRPTASAIAQANHVKFCPQCGFNMEVINAAMAFANQEID